MKRADGEIGEVVRFVGEDDPRRAGEVLAQLARAPPVRGVYRERAVADVGHQANGTLPPVTDPITFVLCIEQNAIRAQALLLCESIRTFGGRWRDAPIVAVAPRPGLGVDHDTQQRLAALNVRYVEASINECCPEYGSANRVFAAAWAEPRAASEWIVVLDSDAVVLGEIDLPDGDVGVRPADSKGTTTAGPGDPFETYWSDLAAICGTTLDVLPFIECTISGHRVRASYNGGLVIARRRNGLLARWADLFARSVDRGLKPCPPDPIRASTGMVTPATAQYWGSNQAALAFTIWGTPTRVAILPDAYNVPLHALAEQPHVPPRWRARPPVHVHYHWMFSPPHVDAAFAVLRTLGVPGFQLDWLQARLPLE